VGWVQLLAPVVRVTGDFTLKIGNTTLTLSGVYFDHPDPSKVGNARPRARKATEAECAEEGGVRRLAREDSGPKRLASGGTRLPFSALRLKRSGRGMLRGGPESDVLRGRGNVIILGGGGNDRLIAGPGDALLVGGSGHDVLIGGSGTDTMIDTRGPALVRTGKKTRRRWDYVYVRDGRADDTVICRSRHTIVVADKGDRVRGHCGEVIRAGPIDQPRPPIP
jgi:hypothetical protein